MIDSFKIDHTKLMPGLYVSRVDKVGDQTITTYDIRMKRPNMESPMRTDVIHTLEHLGASYLREMTDTPVIYFGPMGCRTGFYLILAGEPNLMATLKLVRGMMYFAVQATEIPGASKEECGNAEDHDLELAGLAAAYFLLHTLDMIDVETDERLHYPE